ncbi:MAG: succinate dehydrogenase assembly factor 2 [Betaproteobacteria bacterium]|nr:succinate dehydrogenase assembly factor 2 [Betaproteobacteria bacterium]
MPVDERERERLRWRSRRGLLELDLVLQRFWAPPGPEIDAAQGRALAKLLAMPDNDLLDLVMDRVPNADPALEQMLVRLKAA